MSVNWATEQKYQVTRKFIGGLLKGIEYTEVSTVSFPIGFVCYQPCGGSPYEIIACNPVK